MAMKSEVFETVDPAKSIDELNDEIEPISFPPVKGIVTERAKSTAEIFEYFKELSTPKDLGYVLEPKVPTSYEERLELMQKECEALRNMGEDTAALSEHIAAIRERIRRNTELESASRRLGTGNLAPLSLPEFSTTPLNFEIVQGVDSRTIQDKIRMRQLESRLKRIERLTGDWKGNTSIGEKLGKIYRRMDTLDMKKLEFVEQQAKHLGIDLDGLIGSKTNFQITKEDLIELRKLFGS